MTILERLFKPAGDRAQAAEADALIDRIVAATDPRLVSMKGHREALRAPVLAARGRMRETVARIPGPTEVSAKAWSDDNTVRALFARAADVGPAFSVDAGVRGFFATNPAADCIGMLALEKREKRVLTMEMQGSMQAEVARTTVSFTDPQILAPGADEATVRALLVQRALEYLALRALEHVGAAKAHQRELEKERALLQAELRLAARRGMGFAKMAEGATPRAELEKDLERTVEELQAAASAKLLPSLVAELVSVLGNPDEYLAIEPCTLALDSMNFAVAPGPTALTPQVAMLTLAQRGPYAVLLARFPRTELRADNRLAEAEKFL